MIENLDLRRLFLSFLLVPILWGVTASCNKPAEGPTLKDVEFVVPANVSLEKGQELLSFRVQFQKTPLTSDAIVLTDGAGRQQSCPIVETSVTAFSISIHSLWNGFLTDGPYQVAVGAKRCPRER